MRWRWPLTYKLIHADYTFDGCQLTALGSNIRVDYARQYSVLSNVTIISGNYSIYFPDMDMFERYFDEIYRSIDPTTWAAAKYPHAVKLMAIHYNNTQFAYVNLNIGGYKIPISDSGIIATDSYGIHVEQLEEFLARAYNQRNGALVEIVVRLPQPIAEEIMAQL